MSKVMLPGCTSHQGATGILSGKSITGPLEVIQALVRCRECLRWFHPLQTTLGTKKEA